MGVALALKKLDQTLVDSPDREVVTLGPIIHNPQVLEKYAARGVQRIEDVFQATPTMSVVIRAHGVPRRIEQALIDRGCALTDATCPKVKKAQLLISKAVAEGRSLLLYGEKDHPEVRGLVSYGGQESLVFDSFDALRSLSLKPGTPYVLAAQTTQDREEFERIVHWLGDRCPGMPVLDTICDATRERQAEARDIARSVEYMIVVGGLTSGNTRRLAQVVRDQGTPCTHVESAQDLPLDSLVRFRRIGLTAGASTPRRIIDEVERILTTGLG